MQAVIFDAPHQARVGELAKPQPNPGEVLVAVRAAGICAGDLYTYVNKNPYVAFPIVSGHEIAGEVAYLPEGVGGLHLGQLVVVEPFISCGQCHPCRVGKSNCCANLQIVGVHRDGGYAEYVSVPADRLHVVPEGITALEASFAEPVAIAVQAMRRGEVNDGESVLILGCGPIGLALVEVARAYGTKVFATDVEPDRLAFAKELGAEPLPAGSKLLSAVLDKTDGEGMPVVIEATGVAAVMEQTVELIAAGGRIVLVGLVKKGTGVTFPGLDFTRKELTIVGSRASVGCFPEALRLLASGDLHYPRVATPVPMWDAPKTFETLAVNPSALHKGVLVLEE